MSIETVNAVGVPLVFSVMFPAMMLMASENRGHKKAIVFWLVILVIWFLLVLGFGFRYYPDAVGIEVGRNLTEVERLEQSIK